jgi:hypothetical protein
MIFVKFFEKLKIIALVPPVFAQNFGKFSKKHKRDHYEIGVDPKNYPLKNPGYGTA